MRLPAGSSARRVLGPHLTVIGLSYTIMPMLEDSSNAWYFLFGSGSKGAAARDTLLPYIRVLAVRSRR